MFKERSSQLFTVHAFTTGEKGRKQFPMVYVLMKTRRTEDYVLLFQVLRDAMVERGLDCNPKKFMVDYEAGENLQNCRII